MDAHTEISRVAIVGTGLIGSSWAACFLAHGLDVVLTDPAPGMEDNVREYVEAAWAALTKIGLAPGASTSRLRFESDLKEAVANADLVQENAPEREPIKIKLFAEIDSILPPPAILASSTSGIPMSRIQSECKQPERCVTGPSTWTCTSALTCARVRRWPGSTTRIMEASGPRRKERPEDVPRWAPSCLRRPRKRRPGRRWCRSRRRIYRACRWP